MQNQDGDENILPVGSAGISHGPTAVLSLKVQWVMWKWIVSIQ